MPLTAATLAAHHSGIKSSLWDYFWWIISGMKTAIGMDHGQLLSERALHSL